MQIKTSFLSAIASFVIASSFFGPFAQCEPLSYSFVGAEYYMDSSADFNGRSFDSDDSYAFSGSYQFFDPVYVFSRLSNGGYDMTGHEDFSLNTFSLGLGAHTRLFEEGDYKVDGFVNLSWEYIDSCVQTEEMGRFPFNGNGAGIKVGFRMQLTPSVELSAAAYEVSYGERFLERKGGIDGLNFEVGTTFKISPSWDLTLTYFTGELDYEYLPSAETDDNVEVDRSETRLGVRYTF